MQWHHKLVPNPANVILKYFPTIILMTVYSWEYYNRSANQRQRQVILTLSDGESLQKNPESVSNRFKDVDYCNKETYFVICDLPVLGGIYMIYSLVDMCFFAKPSLLSMSKL